MITIQTVEAASKQDIFNQVLEYSRTMKKKAMDYPGCRYRTRNGDKCFIGSLIRNEDYLPAMEGDISCVLRVLDTDITDDKKKFLINLQCIHDGASMLVWEHDFKNLAEDHNLIYKEPN